MNDDIKKVEDYISKEKDYEFDKKEFEDYIYFLKNIVNSVNNNNYTQNIVDAFNKNYEIENGNSNNYNYNNNFLHKYKDKKIKDNIYTLLCLNSMGIYDLLTKLTEENIFKVKNNKLYLVK